MRLGAPHPPVLTLSYQKWEWRQVSQGLYLSVRTIGICPTPSYRRIAKAQAAHRLRLVDIAQIDHNRLL